jgi:hypothetical protein
MLNSLMLFDRVKWRHVSKIENLLEKGRREGRRKETERS